MKHVNINVSSRFWFMIHMKKVNNYSMTSWTLFILFIGLSGMYRNYSVNLELSYSVCDMCLHIVELLKKSRIFNGKVNICWVSEGFIKSSPPQEPSSWKSTFLAGLLFNFINLFSFLMALSRVETLSPVQGHRPLLKGYISQQVPV